MHRFSKIIAGSLAAITFFSFVPFFPIPRAQAADDSAVFTQCMEKGLGIAILKSGLQTAIEAAMASAVSGAAVAASTAASAINVPTTNPTLAAPTGVTTGTTVASAIWQDDVKPYFDEVAYITGQCALEQLTNNTIKWIQGGFHGSPSFAIKPDRLFLDLQNVVARELAQQVISADVDLTEFVPGFRNRLSNSIQLSTRVDYRGKFATELQTTFPVGVDPLLFYNDFNQGGWEAYAASLRDNNNPFGVILMTDRELAARQMYSQNIQQQQLAWSKGFIDLVDLDACDYGSAYVLDDSGQPDPAEYDSAEIATIQKANCGITTPGNIISDQLSKTLDTDMDRLGFADDMNKIITALISKLVQDTVRHVF